MANQANRLTLIAVCIAGFAGSAQAEHKGRTWLNSLNEPYYDEMSRSDFVALNAGDAPRSNITIQAPTPWPEYVNDTDIPMDGVTGELVIQNFFARHAKPAASGAPVINLNMGAPAPGPTP